MHYGQIYFCDTANGIGMRTSLFVSGCRHHCRECFNPETWDFAYGEPYTDAVEEEILDSLNHDYINGLTVLGGEPMEPENQKVVRRLLTRVKQTLPGKSVWIYSGYTWEELHDRTKNCCTEDTAPILDCTDILVDGEFVLSKKDISLRFRGSSNQRIIDVQETIRTGQIVLSPYSIRTAE